MDGSTESGVGHSMIGMMQEGSRMGMLMYSMMYVYESNRQNSRILRYVLAGHWFSEDAKN